MSTARRLDRPGFGHDGGSNLADYLSATDRARQIELEMEPGEQLVEIPVGLIDRSPFQARATFDPEEIAALAEDIQEHGLNHPVTVREGSGGRYELVAGERRWLAAKSAGLTNILARVRSLDDFTAHLVGVSENNRRANLSAWEMSVEAARLMQHAKDCDRPHTQRDLARYLNRNVSLVNYQLAIAAALTPDILEGTQVSEAMLCGLPHVTLRRIAALPEERRGRALKEAFRMQQLRASGANEAATPSQVSAHRSAEVSSGDRWDEQRDHRGFELKIRKPFQEITPHRAEQYLQEIMPVIGELAAQAAKRGTADRGPIIQWANPRGTLLFVPTLNQTDGMRYARIREAVDRLFGAQARPTQETE